MTTAPPTGVLVVDGANVVGSVPDGWWRDRAGAAARLHAGLVGSPLGFTAVVLVLEGRAVAGVPAGQDAGVTTVHATGSGDDELYAQCRALRESGVAVTLASADRGLAARVASLGVDLLGPRTLRDQLVNPRFRAEPS